MFHKFTHFRFFFKIITKYPRIEIRASADHLFFVRTENGIEEKSLREIKEGDYLIMLEKIDLALPYQKLNFTPEIKSRRNLKDINLPTLLNEDLARVLGYYLGDGSYEIDRLSFFEQRKNVALFYKNLMENAQIVYRLMNETKSNLYFERNLSWLMKRKLVELNLGS